MPNDTPRRLALNIPLIALWVVSLAVGAIGFWQLQAGNAGQADFYNTGGSDYLTFLGLQTQSTIAGMLLIAGIIGVLLAIAVHARNRAAAIIAREAAAAALAPVGYDEIDVYDEIDEAPDAAPAPVPGAAFAEAAPAEERAADASAAVTATEEPGPDAVETDVVEASADEPKATDADGEPKR